MRASVDTLLFLPQFKIAVLRQRGGQKLGELVDHGLTLHEIPIDELVALYRAHGHRAEVLNDFMLNARLRNRGAPSKVNLPWCSCALVINGGS